MRPSQTLLMGIGLSAVAAAQAAAQSSALIPGANVNMVSGTQWPDGDPFLQRQNEPSIAVSTRNPLHLLAGANDYRTVDLPGLPEGKETGDAWLGVFRSVDGGGSWKSTLVRGYPQDAEGSSSPLYRYEAAADPVVRAGANGLFYYSGIVFDRSLQRSAAFVARFMDLNNETVEPIRYIDTVRVDHFDAGEAFIDKPWLEVDIPRDGAQSITLSVPQGGGTVSQTVSCGNVYMAWAEITGQGAALRTRIMFSRSTDCGATWSNPVPLSLTDTVGQGATIAVSPATGRVYVAWRQFRSATVSCVREKGFWKDNSNAWPVGSLMVGGVSYTRQQALTILKKAVPPSDAPYVLAQQLIPAKLNVLSGAANSAIGKTISDADAWLVKFPLGSKPSSGLKQVGLALKDQLEAFNKGLAGTPTCTSATTSYPDAILVARSDDAGLSFSTPQQVASVSPFDQGTSEYSFRTNAYPTMAVDETGRAYLAWATRGLATPNADPVAGDARIVVTTSRNGTSWTTPKPIDQPTMKGHQLFPSLTYNTGKLLLAYNDYRADASGVFERFVVDLLDASHPMRHTVDVRAAIASPGDAPEFTNYSLLRPSSQVSRYPFIPTVTEEEPTSLQLQHNPPNLPMFERGRKPFFGDYHDVAGAPRFVPNGNGSWIYNTAASSARVFHAVWTDNRDVVGPPDGDWTSYVPPGTGGPSRFDPDQTVDPCDPLTDFDRTQIRNQNIYTSRLTSGLFVAVPSNSRPLSDDFQRAFVVFVQNATDTPRQFELKILNQPAGGGTASFEQFATVTGIPSVSIGAYSSISQPVFVQSGNPTASVDVHVTELGNCGNACLTSTVRINPDSSNPSPADATLLAGETYNPAVFNPAVFNPAVYNPAVFNPAVFNPAVFNIDPSNPAVLNYEVDNPAVYNPAVLNPAVYNTALEAFNIIMTSLAFLNPAVFNPAVFNPAVFNPAVFNPAVFNPAVLNPAVLNPAVFNPAVFNPAVFNPAVYNPAVFNPAVLNSSLTEANYVAQNAGNATMAYSFNLNLANAPPTGLLFQLMIYRLYFVPVANGCELTEAVQQELLVNDLDPNLNADLLDPNGGDSFLLNPGDIAIATLRVIPNPSSPGDPAQFNVEDLSASVVSKGANTADTQPPAAIILASSMPPLVITTTALPNAVVGSSYGPFSLLATGGAGPRTWTLAPGSTLPSGLNLSTSGALAGMPAAAGSFDFTVRVTDPTGVVEKALSLSVLTDVLGSLAFTSQPQGTTAGQAIPSFSVTALDTTASPLPGVSITVTIGSSACPTGALSGTTTQLTNATGTATFSDVSIGRGGRGYALRASATVGSVTLDADSTRFSLIGFCETSSMGAARVGASMTRLTDGRVLVVGGADGSNTPLSSAEIFDPATGVWTPTGSLALGARSLHTATLLADGRVLIAGGSASVLPATGDALGTAEVFDPTAAGGAGAFSATATTPIVPRMAHTATLLPDGRVLVAGGRSSAPSGFQDTAELYDPSLGTFTPATGSLTTARDSHTATLLSDGRVLLVGGFVASSTYLNSAEIFDPATGTSGPTGSMSSSRINHTATRLRDGRVLVAGGTTTGGSTLAAAEVFDPATGTFAMPVPMAFPGREQHTAALLSNGQVLLTGGHAGSPPFGVVLSSAEIFDPAASGGAGAFSTTHGMASGRHLHVATEVSDGRVLVAGGYGSSGSSIAGAETFVGPWTIDFEYYPGPDGLLGTGDDVPTPVCPPAACPVLVGLGGQYASIGITFSQGTLFYESPPIYADPWFSQHFISSTTLAASFSVPVRRVSITSYSAWNVTLTAYDASNNVIGTSVLEHPSPGGGFFLGTVSLSTTQPITRFSVRPDNPAVEILNLDDLVFTEN